MICALAVFTDGVFWKLVPISDPSADLVEYAGGIDTVLHDIRIQSQTFPVYWDPEDPEAWKASREELSDGGISGVEALKCKAAVRKELRKKNDKRNRS